MSDARARGIAAALFLAAVALVIFTGGADDPARPGYSTVIHEDDPRWNCHTMGNKICGPGRG